jgi:antitoxin PrlF
MSTRKKASYTGSVATSGNSEAIRFEKAFFKACPEFRQKAKVRAHPIAPGQVLLSIEEEVKEEESMEDDPTLAAFLSFLDQEMKKRPELIQPLDESVLQRARELVKGVPRCEDEELPEDFTL